MNDQPLAVEKHPKYLGFVLDSEFTCSKHIDHIILKSKKRLNILKYISGRDWGADAATLRTTYMTLIRPILEYGSAVYCCASKTNLQRLERVQLSAARIITGLRNSCPNEIALFEADLQPLSLRRNSGLTKYFSKLASFGTQNRTSEYLLRWRNNQRLQRYSPFSLAISKNMIHKNVMQHSLKQCLDPSLGLNQVYFHANLPSQVSKNSETPAFLRQLALEIINKIPEDCPVIYTDGSKDERGCSGSGIYILSQGGNKMIRRRNPDHCSVFRSELIAINEGIGSILSFPGSSPVWILSDSLSSIQYLSNWQRVRDSTGMAIINKLKHLSSFREVHFQWIPSHVDIHGNETADLLAKEGSSEPLNTSDSLTYSEIFSRAISSDSASWNIPPAHHWYQGKRPGEALSLQCCRSDQTAITRFKSGHIRSLCYTNGKKTFPICAKCSSEQAAPDHILDCLGLSRLDLYSNPIMVLDFLRVTNIIDLV